MDKKGLCYPFIDELNYLSSINMDEITDEIEKLKELILNPKDDKDEDEIELEEISKENLKYLKIILKKIDEDRRRSSKELIISMKRKHPYNKAIKMKSSQRYKKKI